MLSHARVLVRSVLILQLLVGQGAAWSEVRFVGGGSPAEGRVEVRQSSMQPWFTVCDDGWDLASANVVCRQRGYPLAWMAKMNGVFGPGIGDSVSVRCGGWEDDLLQCEWRLSENCQHREDAGVVCFGSTVASPPPPPSPSPPPPHTPTPPAPPPPPSPSPPPPTPQPPSPPSPPPRPPRPPPSPPLPPFLERVAAAVGVHPLFGAVLILLLGAVIAVIAATVCVSIEVTVYRDGRRRYRLGCCIRPTTPAAPGSATNGTPAPTPDAPSRQRAAEDGLSAGPSTLAAPIAHATPPSRSAYSKIAGWIAGDQVTQEML